MAHAAQATQQTAVDSLDFLQSCPPTPIYCPHCSTSTTVKGRFKIYKLGRGLRTHIQLKHDGAIYGDKELGTDNKSSKDKTSLQASLECTEWVTKWLHEVVIKKKYKESIPQPNCFSTQVLIPILERLALEILPTPNPQLPPWSPPA